jgi:hypothetical protein
MDAVNIAESENIMKQFMILLLIYAGTACGQQSNSIILSDTTMVSCWGKFSFGEFPYRFNGINDTTEKYKTIIGKDTMLSPAPYGAMVLITLVQSYDTYAKKCYNDSTEAKNIAHMDSLGNWIYHYWHTRPTFEGFIEYLRKKIK